MSSEKIKKVIRDAFNEASVGYDRPAMRFFDNSAALLAEKLSLRGNEHVMDAATGTGKIALALARRLKKGHVTGVDLSAGMLSCARQKAEQAKRKNVTFLQNDIDAIFFPRESFDGLTCGFGVHFWPLMEKSLMHLARLVRKNGFVAITSFAKGSFEPHASMCLNQFARYGIKLPKTYSLERLDTIDKNQALFRACGFQNIQCEKNQVGYYLGAPNDWWDLVLFTGYRAFLNQLSKAQVKKFKDEFLEAVAVTKDNRGIFLHIEVITAIGKIS